MDTPVIFISTVQVAITVFSIAMGAIGQPLLTDYFDAWIATTLAYAIAFLILTYLSVTLGELVPKAIALQRAEALAVVLALSDLAPGAGRTAARVAAPGIRDLGDAPVRHRVLGVGACSPARERTCG